MKKGMTTGIFALAFALFMASGCKKVEEVPPPVPATLVSIALQPSAPGMVPGTTLQLQAIGNYDDNSVSNLTSAVTWESADPAVATVSGTGLVTAANTGAASTTITARSGTVSGSTVLTLSPLQSLSVAPADQTIAGGTSQQFTTIGTLQNGATQDLTAFVTWSSSDAAIATISGTGLASTVSSPTGSIIITAARDTVTGTTSLTSAAVTSIAVTPASASIALGTSRQFTAIGTLTGGITQNLTTFALWSSSSPSVATVGNTAGSFGLAESRGTGTTNILASFGTVTSIPLPR